MKGDVVFSESSWKKFGHTRPPIEFSKRAAASFPNKRDIMKMKTPFHAGQTGSLANFSTLNTSLMSSVESTSRVSICVFEIATSEGFDVEHLIDGDAKQLFLY